MALTESPCYRRVLSAGTILLPTPTLRLPWPSWLALHRVCPWDIVCQCQCLQSDAHLTRRGMHGLVGGSSAQGGAGRA
jgi:hypothetical protein